jgi:hypothetical protein
MLPPRNLLLIVWPIVAAGLGYRKARLLYAAAVAGSTACCVPGVCCFVRPMELLYNTIRTVKGALTLDLR